MGAAIIDRISRHCGNNRDLTLLIAANVALALLLWAVVIVAEFTGRETSPLYFLCALPSDPLLFASHPWTLLTYMFVHFSPLHLLFNMLWLFWFGGMLSDVERGMAPVWLFMAGGAAGGVFYLAGSALSGYTPGAFLTGSSAAVLAVMCATATRMPDRTVRLFLFGEVRLKWIAAVCVILTLAGSGSAVPTLSAHVAGALTGVIQGMTRRRTAARAARSPRHNVRAMANAMQRSAADSRNLHERLDQLLDKVRVSGYDSLTMKEKAELNHISKRINT